MESAHPEDRQARSAAARGNLFLTDRARASRRIALIFFALCFSWNVKAQPSTAPQPIVIDATAPTPPPGDSPVRLGSSLSPSGETIGVNSRYLTLDGKPWLPAMGEFHFSRYPEQYWEEEILKMKAGGIQIISTYVIWIHHEEVEGQFDWKGQRDLHHFAELCAKHGMLLYPRIGPWSHAEVRNGGFPDWLLKKSATRKNDPTYLAYVTRYYDQIGAQLKGLLWKDGGPVIGIQLENEYSARGPEAGAEHIQKLKEIAVAAGLDVPLYTVTGWDNAIFPPDEVLPVFGGYPDAPWEGSTKVLPPGDIFQFHFGRRRGGDMGAPGSKAPAVPQEVRRQYPSLAAEYGGGMEPTYHRRVVVSADDVAASLPVQLGSGINLYGYYMFQGGENPDGKLTTLQESQRTGSATDVPVKSYDFEAPLGEFGEMRPSFSKLKLYNLFMQSFGVDLAPMVPRKPDVTPAGPGDFSVPRVGARTNGDRGFLFVGNYVRNYPQQAHKSVQIEVRLPGETLLVPQSPVDVPAGAYFIWPLNLDLAGVDLKYSTAQPFTRITDGAAEYYFFAAVPGIASEFCFDSKNLASLDASSAVKTTEGGKIIVRGVLPSTSVAITLHTQAGTQVHIVLLNQRQAEDTWRVHLAGMDRILISGQQVFVDETSIHLRSVGKTGFSVAIFPALKEPRSSAANFHRTGDTGAMFATYTAAVRPVALKAEYSLSKNASEASPVAFGPAFAWRKDKVALAPDKDGLSASAEWKLSLPKALPPGVSDVYMKINYTGDVARLYAGDELLDDDFFLGVPWTVGLKRYAQQLKQGGLWLQILPLRKDAPIYMEENLKPAFPSGSQQIVELKAITLVPEYEVVIDTSAGQ